MTQADGEHDIQTAFASYTTAESARLLAAYNFALSNAVMEGRSAVELKALATELSAATRLRLQDEQKLSDSEVQSAKLLSVEFQNEWLESFKKKLMMEDLEEKAKKFTRFITTSDKEDAAAKAEALKRPSLFDLGRVDRKRKREAGIFGQVEEMASIVKKLKKE